MVTVLPYLALSMGAISSFHCLGMCGPIALAIPVRTTQPWVRYVNYLFYNLGRAFTYSCLGFLVGSVATTIRIAGYLDYLSIGLGILLILYVIMNTWKASSLRIGVGDIGGGLLKKKMAAYLHSSSIWTRFLLGILNGLLPCGMVMMALVSSMATGGAWQGAVFMFLFGLATFPVMLGVSFFKDFITPQFRSKITKYAPVFLLVIGVWLIIRGNIVEFSAVNSSIPVCGTN